MKSYISYSLLAAAAATGMALGADTAYTTPVGYVSLGNTTGNAVAANSDAVISVPLARETEFAGKVASVSGSVVTVTGATWTASQFTTVPYLLTIKTGPEAGLTALITANTTNTATLTVIEGTLANVVAGNDLTISKSWTAKTLIPPSSVPAGTQLLIFAGTTPGINVAASQILTAAPAAWVQTFGGSGNADNFLLYPTESFILRSGATAVASLVVAGEVPRTPQRAALVKLSAAGTSQDIRLSYYSPVTEGILDSGIGKTAGDQLLSFNNAATGRNKAANEILTFTGSAWVGTFGISGSQNNYQLQGGKGYVLRRAASAPAGSVNWSDTQTYIPNL